MYHVFFICKLFFQYSMIKRGCRINQFATASQRFMFSSLFTVSHPPVPPALHLLLSDLHQIRTLPDTFGRDRLHSRSTLHLLLCFLLLPDWKCSSFNCHSDCHSTAFHHPDSMRHSTLYNRNLLRTVLRNHISDSQFLSDRAVPSLYNSECFSDPVLPDW